MSEIVLTCDTVVIGAGTAGVAAFKAASAEGVNCVLVESGPLGTSAKRSGDTPISTLMAAGKTSHALMELEKHGIKGLYELGLGLDLDQVLNNVRAIRVKDTSEVLSFIYRIAEEKRLIGKARFLDAHSLMVNESHLVRFKTAVVATGATSIIPYELNQYSAQALAAQAAKAAQQAALSGESADLGAADLAYRQAASGGVYTPQELFELDHLPNSMAIFGSNREGLQIGQALAYLGVKVVVFGQHHIWKLTDESVIDAAIDAFKDRFDLVLESFTTAIDKYDQGFGIYYMDGTNYENVLGVDTILAANVRYPKLEGLNLRPLGVELERTGCIKIDPKTMQTSAAHIFAAGEVTDLDRTIVNCRNDGTVAGVNAARQALSMPPLPALAQIAPKDDHEGRYMGRGPVTAQAGLGTAPTPGLGLPSVKRADYAAPDQDAAAVAAATSSAAAIPESSADDALPERLLAAADATIAADLSASGEAPGSTDGAAGAAEGAGAAPRAAPASASGAAVSSALYQYRSGSAPQATAASPETGGPEAGAQEAASPDAGTQEMAPAAGAGTDAALHGVGADEASGEFAAPVGREPHPDLYEVRRSTLEKWAQKVEHGSPEPRPVPGQLSPELQAELRAQAEAGRAVQFMERLPDFKLDILHTDPELAMVGLSYEEVKERARRGYPFVSSEVRATEGRYRITHEEGGILRLYCDEASHIVLGAEMCLHDAGHLAHFLAQAIASQRTVEQLYALPYFSSSYEEIIKEAADQAIKNIARKGQGL